MKKFLLLFLVVAVIGISELVLEKRDIREDVAGSLDRDKSKYELITYDNSAFGIRLTLPDDWHVYEDGGVVVSPFGKKYLAKGEDQAALEIKRVGRVEDSGKASEEVGQAAESWLSGIRQVDAGQAVSVKRDNVVLDGHEVLRAKADGFNLVEKRVSFWQFWEQDYVPGQGVFYWFFHNGSIYMMSYAYSAGHKDKFEPMLKNIANSLRFID